MPKNIINTPLDDDDQLQYLKKENERVRQNNVDYKLQLIEARKQLREARKKLQTIEKIIKTKTNGQNETAVRTDATRNY